MIPCIKEIVQPLVVKRKPVIGSRVVRHVVGHIQRVAHGEAGTALKILAVCALGLQFSSLVVVALPIAVLS